MSMAGITDFDPRLPAGVISSTGPIPREALREAEVASAERAADRALWDADPEFAASLGIEPPPLVDTGHLRASFVEVHGRPQPGEWAILSNDGLRFRRIRP